MLIELPHHGDLPRGNALELIGRHIGLEMSNALGHSPSNKGDGNEKELGRI
ncbi:hypothetical protein D3C80_1746920 [compost metagenome]